MTRAQLYPSWRSKEFIFRLLLSYFLIPIVPPVFVLISSRAFGRMSFSVWLNAIMFYGIFGFAAMLILGTPLLICYLRLGWNGFVPFMVGGGLCAGIVAYAMMQDKQYLGLVELFILAGIISGLLFRLILFGFRWHLHGL